MVSGTIDVAGLESLESLSLVGGRQRTPEHRLHAAIDTHAAARLSHWLEPLLWSTLIGVIAYSDPFEDLRLVDVYVMMDGRVGDYIGYNNASDCRLSNWFDSKVMRTKTLKNTGLLRLKSTTLPLHNIPRLPDWVLSCERVHFWQSLVSRGVLWFYVSLRKPIAKGILKTPAEEKGLNPAKLRSTLTAQKGLALSKPPSKLTGLITVIIFLT